MSKFAFALVELQRSLSSPPMFAFSILDNKRLLLAEMQASKYIN